MVASDLIRGKERHPMGSNPKGNADNDLVLRYFPQPKKQWSTFRCVWNCEIKHGSRKTGNGYVSGTNKDHEIVPYNNSKL